MRFSLQSCSGNSWQSRSLKPTQLGFPKSLSAPNSLYIKTAHFCLKLAIISNLKLSVVYKNKGLFLLHTACSSWVSWEWCCSLSWWRSRYQKHFCLSLTKRKENEVRHTLVLVASARKGHTSFLLTSHWPKQIARPYLSLRGQETTIFWILVNNTTARHKGNALSHVVRILGAETVFNCKRLKPETRVA